MIEVVSVPFNSFDPQNLPNSVVTKSKELFPDDHGTIRPPLRYPNFVDETARS